MLAYLLGLSLAKAAAPTAPLGIMPTATAQMGVLHMEKEAALLTALVLGELQTMAPALLTGVLPVPHALQAGVLQAYKSRINHSDANSAACTTSGGTASSGG